MEGTVMTERKSICDTRKRLYLSCNDCQFFNYCRKLKPVEFKDERGVKYGRK